MSVETLFSERKQNYVEKHLEIWQRIVTASYEKLILPVRRFSNGHTSFHMQMGTYTSRSNSVEPQWKQVDERNVTKSAGNLTLWRRNFLYNFSTPCM